MFTVKDYMLCYIAVKLGSKVHIDSSNGAGEWAWSGYFLDIAETYPNKHNGYRAKTVNVHKSMVL